MWPPSRVAGVTAFEIDRVGFQIAESRTRQRFARNVGRKGIRLQVEQQSITRVNSDRVAVIRAVGDNLRADNDARVLATHFDAHAEFFNDAGEHIPSAVERCCDR